MNDLSGEQPERLKEMRDLWRQCEDAYRRNCGHPIPTGT
jgi:hypothetical protein